MVDTPTTERLKLGAPRGGVINFKSPTPYGWAPLAVLILVGLVDRIEFGLLSGVLPLVQAEWGFSDTVAGSIPTASALAAALFSLPAGYFADRHNRTRIIAVVVFLWALATLGSGLATGFAMFYAMRVFLSAAESIDNPAAGSLLADYYPPATRPQAYGWTRVTTYLGGIGTILGGVLAEAFGWRSAFLFMVIPGVLTALIVWRLHEPARGQIDRMMAGVTAESAAKAVPKPPFVRQIREVLAIRTLLVVTVGLALLSLGLAGVFYWLPSLMVRNFGVGAGTAGSLSGLITIVGVLGGTLIGSRLGRIWHETRKGGRLLAGGGGITIGSVVLAVGLMMDTIVLYCLFMLIASLLMSMAIPNLTASLADVVGASSRGLGFAVLQVFLTAGAAFGPLIVGIVSDSTGSLVSAMYALIVPMVLGGLITLAARGSFERDSRRVLEEAGR
ncbi:MFS transporter [Streptosporangium lutulentum]|uniref:MFS family permease n=1 Tax=Streptosporangium lutulentum TaxID=1461250 RepID=A0ABT9QQS6_9ACTN|nr:MFS transporter [Streptosporangium lutulentum]MDP9848259.1 MFS family permease [Streptosporangium lutulentum]